MQCQPAVVGIGTGKQQLSADSKHNRLSISPIISCYIFYLKFSDVFTAEFPSDLSIAGRYFYVVV